VRSGLQDSGNWFGGGQPSGPVRAPWPPEPTPTWRGSKLPGRWPNQRTWPTCAWQLRPFDTWLRSRRAGRPRPGEAASRSDRRDTRGPSIGPEVATSKMVPGVRLARNGSDEPHQPPLADVADPVAGRRRRSAEIRSSAFQAIARADQSRPARAAKVAPASPKAR
jgi:hypothetical protein